MLSTICGTDEGISIPMAETRGMVIDPPGLLLTNLEPQALLYFLPKSGQSPSQCKSLEVQKVAMILPNICQKTE